MSTIAQPEESRAFQPQLRTADYFDQQPEEADAGEDWTAEHTLSQFFARYFLPTCLAQRDPETLRAYKESVAHWAALTGDPPLGRISPKTLSQFIAGLAELPGKKAGSKMAKATIAKHVRHVQPILDCAGPENKDNRAGVGALEKTPYFQRVKVPKQPPRPEFSLEELGQLLDACSIAARPKIAHLTATAWWQALIVVIYNTGLRIGSCLDLRYDWIRTDGATGWAAIVPEAIKHEQGRDVPLNSAAVSAMQTIRTSRDLVFPWDCRRRHLDDVFQSIKKAAGLPPADGRMFHAIRRLTSSQLAKQGPGVAQFVLGHAGLSTTKAHYINGATAVHFTQQLQQPITRPADRQRRLFE